MTLNFCVIVVLFNSGPSDELLAIEAIDNVNLIIVDNSSVASESSHLHYIHNANAGGLAGAYNAAIKYILNMSLNPDFIMFMDDDTPISGVFSAIANPNNMEALAITDVAAVSGIYRDINTGLRGRMILTSTFVNHSYPREQDGLKEVSYLINSLSIWKMEAISKIGFFNEAFKVDHIDTEYCLRAASLGYKMMCNYSLEFDHEIGNRTKYVIFGITLQTGNHTPHRRYMIGRNTARLLMKYILRRPAVSYLMFTRIIYELLGIAHEENNKYKKISMLLVGIFDGMFWRKEN